MRTRGSRSTGLTMPSAWIERRPTGRGDTRYVVRYRLGGRETKPRYGGSFKMAREAKIRREWIGGELAAMRVPDLSFVEEEPIETLAHTAERWLGSRIDVAERTKVRLRVDIQRILAILGERPTNRITAAEVAETIGRLHADGFKPETIRKTLGALAMVLDFAGVSPNPARDKIAVKLPRNDRAEVNPPTRDHVLAIYGLLPTQYRLPLLVLDATGMRVGELERLTWGDMDEPESRWRVSASAAKTRRPRWVPVPEIVLQTVSGLVPRDDRDLSAQVFAGFGNERFRTAMTRACKAAAIPAYSPHDLRHRRATLWHLRGVPAAEAAAWLGHSAQEHLRTYAHATLVDRSELDYGSLVLAAERTVHPSVHTHAAKTLD